MNDHAGNEEKRGCVPEKTGDAKAELVQREVNVVEMLNKIACCCTHERLIVSQVAVLTSVALHPTITSCGLVNETGISLQNVGRILNYLVNVGDLTFVREKAKKNDYRSLPRHFYITAQGIVTIRMMMRHLRWGNISFFRIVESHQEGENMDGLMDMSGVRDETNGNQL